MNPSESPTYERLRQILANEFDVELDLIHPATPLNQLAIDSLAVIEVIFRLEDEFNISFTQDRGGLLTVGDLACCVDRLATEQHGGASPGAAVP